MCRSSLRWLTAQTGHSPTFGQGAGPRLPCHRYEEGQGTTEASKIGEVKVARTNAITICTAILNSIIFT